MNRNGACSIWRKDKISKKRRKRSENKSERTKILHFAKIEKTTETTITENDTHTKLKKKNCNCAHGLRLHTIKHISKTFICSNDANEEWTAKVKSEEKSEEKKEKEEEEVGNKKG